MTAHDITAFMENPLTIVVTYIVILIPLIFSLIQLHIKGKNRYKNISIGLSLILLARVIQNLRNCIFPIQPKTVSHIILSIIIVAVGIVGVVLVVRSDKKLDKG